jgi:AraC family transcriptional regulator
VHWGYLIQTSNSSYMPDVIIKNMVCPRCILAVQQVLQQNHLEYDEILLGKVKLKSQPSISQMEAFHHDLEKLGFAILQDKDVQKIEQIKTLFLSLFQADEIPSGLNITEYIRKHMAEDYSSLSHLFSSLEGITMEKYFIQLKIEKVKEWLFYQEMQLSEMAYKLDYSSVQHLSSQFKKTTGMTPTAYKKLIGDKGWKV